MDLLFGLQLGGGNGHPAGAANLRASGSTAAGHGLGACKRPLRRSQSQTDAGNRSAARAGRSPADRAARTRRRWGAGARPGDGNFAGVDGGALLRLHTRPLPWADGSGDREARRSGLGSIRGDRDGSTCLTARIGYQLATPVCQRFRASTQTNPRPLIRSHVPRTCCRPERKVQAA